MQNLQYDTTSRIRKATAMYRVAENMRNLIGNSLNDWNTQKAAGEEILRNVKIKRWIFQGSSMFLLLLVLAMILLTKMKV